MALIKQEFLINKETLCHSLQKIVVTQLPESSVDNRCEKVGIVHSLSLQSETATGIWK